MPLFLFGTIVGGGVVGTVFMASLAIASYLAPPRRRGQVASSRLMGSKVA